MSKLLLVVDFQYDFLDSGMVSDSVKGALPVPGTNHIWAETLRAYIKNQCQNGEYVICTGDLHPEDHISFIENGGVFPSHCVKNDGGSYLYSDIQSYAYFTAWKGFDPSVEAFSIFKDESGNRTCCLIDNMNEPVNFNYILEQLDITEIEIVGLAFDYCVAQTAKDAADLGYKVIINSKFTKSVNPENDDQLIHELEHYKLSILVI